MITLVVHHENGKVRVTQTRRVTFLPARDGIPAHLVNEAGTDYLADAVFHVRVRDDGGQVGTVKQGPGGDWEWHLSHREL